MNNLQADEGYIFESGKTYTHSIGLSCAFRQWRAKDSHCRYFHGYALQVTITFRSVKLNEANWVQDFGALKPVKKWLEDTFDHKLLVARDDPELNTYLNLSEKGLADVKVVDHIGCEAFAKMIFDSISTITKETYTAIDPAPGSYVDCVEVREHEGNFARYRRA